MKQKARVAAIQMEIEPCNVTKNLKKAKILLNNLFSIGHCDLVVFPEDFITGPIPYNLELSQNEKSLSIKTFKELAILYKTYIVCGSIIKKKGNKYYNTSFLIDSKGNIILEYQKNNLWNSERSYLTRGENIKVANTPIGNIGIIICWDLAFPEMCRKLAKLGADIICCPSYWTVADGGRLISKYSKDSEKLFVNTICPARAIENEVLFIYANGAGKAKEKLKTKMWVSDQIGQSQICVPVFGTVAKINDNSEGFITYEFDRNLIVDAEKVYKIKSDLNKHE